MSYYLSSTSPARVIGRPRSANPFRAIRAYFRNRAELARAYQELDKLSDRELSDIGLNRAGIATALRAGRQ